MQSQIKVSEGNFNEIFIYVLDNGFSQKINNVNNFFFLKINFLFFTFYKYFNGLFGFPY